MNKILCCLTLMVAGPLFAKQTIELLTLVDKIGPYLNDGQEPKIKGLMIDLLDQVEKDLGIKFKYTRVPYGRAKLMIKNGKYMGFFPQSFNEKRDKISVFPKGREGEVSNVKFILNSKDYLYAHKSWSKSFTNAEIMSHVGDVIILRGSNSKNILEKVNKDLKTFDVSTFEQGLRMLNAGRKQLGFFPELATKHTLKRNPHLGENIRSFKEPLLDRKYYLHFSPAFAGENSKLVESIWKAIAVHRDRIYGEGVDKYID